MISRPPASLGDPKYLKTRRCYSAWKGWTTGALIDGSNYKTYTINYIYIYNPFSHPYAHQFIHFVELANYLFQFGITGSCRILW